MGAIHVCGQKLEGDGGRFAIRCGGRKLTNCFETPQIADEAGNGFYDRREAFAISPAGPAGRRRRGIFCRECGRGLHRGACARRRYRAVRGAGPIRARPLGQAGNRVKNGASSSPIAWSVAVGRFRATRRRRASTNPALSKRMERCRACSMRSEVSFFSLVPSSPGTFNQSSRCGVCGRKCGQVLFGTDVLAHFAASRFVGQEKESKAGFAKLFGPALHALEDAEAVLQIGTDFRDLPRFRVDRLKDGLVAASPIVTPTPSRRRSIVAGCLERPGPVGAKGRLCRTLSSRPGECPSIRRFGPGLRCGPGLEKGFNSVAAAGKQLTEVAAAGSSHACSGDVVRGRMARAFPRSRPPRPRPSG